MAEDGLTIVIDVGSSGAKLGAVRGDQVAGPRRLARADGRSVREHAEGLVQGGEATFVVYGSDPGKARDLAWEIDKLRMGPTVVLEPDHRGLPAARVEQPERAGMDRRVQVLGASSLVGGAVVVISCGTALTVDLGDEEGALEGGAILPGLTLGMRALAAATARLPVVDLEGAVAMPARDTETAIRTGVVVGAAGAVAGLLARADAAGRPVFLTGADAPRLAPHLDGAHRTHPALGFLGAAEAARRGRA